MLGSEAHVPYNRPPLSKEFLRGSAGRDDIQVVDAAWFDKHEVALETNTTVVALDPAAQRVRTGDGTSIEYDSLLLATGSAPRRLTIPGAELDGVHYLRTMDDATALHEALAAGGRTLVIIGSGWIGLEVAATARSLGNEVVVLSREGNPVQRALGAELGGFFAELHESRGVQIRRSVAVTGIAEAQGRASGVLLDSGETIPADIVLVAVGAQPLTGLAESAGIAVDDGVLVDAAMRTSASNVFAAGDIANVKHPTTGLRVRSEHWANARAGGAAAARSMLGLEVSFDDVPSFLSAQFGISVGYFGFPLGDGAVDVHYRGDRSSGSFIAFRLSQGRPVGALTVDVRGVSSAITSLIRRGQPVDHTRLTDPAVALDDL